jgi:hypothetical protein
LAEELIVIQKAYDLIAWAVPAIGKFPRSHRFVLGERMEEALYDLLDLLIEAKYYPGRRAALLRQANVLLERFRFQMRLAEDLQCLGLKQYEHLSVLLLEVGRLVGGWEKTTRQTAGARS